MTIYDDIWQNNVSLKAIVLIVRILRQKVIYPYDSTFLILKII